MARGLFDLINQYNDSQGGGGYSGFNPGYLDPAQAVALQARGNLQSSPGTGPALLGNVAGGVLGGLATSGINKYRSRKPAAKLAESLNSAINSALDEKTARILKDNPGMNAREAIIAASEELFASTSGSKQDPRFKDMVRSAAMGRLSSAGEFDPEAQAKFGAAAKDFAESRKPVDPGDIKVLEGPNGQRVSLPETEAIPFLRKNPSFQLIDTPPTGSAKEGDTVTSYEGDKRLTFVRDPTGRLTGKQPNAGGWVEYSGDARAAAGGDVPVGADKSTKSDLSERENDLMHSFSAAQLTNQAIDNIRNLTLESEKAGIQGTTGTVGAIYKFLGESASVVSAGAGLAKEVTMANNGDPKIYAGGTMTYGELTDPSKYDSVFKNFKGGAVASQRVRAAMINLAYMMAIAQESSARAISDNDIKLRLETLGSNMSSGEGMRQVLEDRRRDTFFSLQSRLDNDKTFSSDPFYRSRLANMMKPYNVDFGASGKVGTPPAGPVSGTKVVIGSDGQVKVIAE